ncbi:tRNA (adenosine(37)-N6)-threonylcarbamoyltransferase complex dimerization subunit type 1 TsaB [Piscinibacter gummiphilus]|uniref:tRNA (Adenosine(37)-N6)-threonylcarbamoyltransferase complex dimerization subunit type 1 TsaB n=1 Tax=Piscinibacter gummiphilus TaxID=946333 RepID=A0ABZ0CS78_9BURK|nr:tRNA (adenosine(37)-N6)-threonylcarbamoyltransferase complex dimerization subunit type 1 TsaB [Piscinibacter gummiphilus]WOB07832.1 tRNA (adenosine(37)-N6)-threonylcarbamoyltransferase complex dimerization subunit type 1 TsaB [Piscinibacter gummiphilus]
MTRLLAFDTSTDAMSLALLTPQGRRARDEAGGAKASARLLPELLAMLADAGSTLQELDAIAFGCGPGAFTGLRTACSVAQGLAFGASKPVVPVDSLLIVAQDARTQLADDAPAELWVAMDARMDEVYAGAYRWESGRWTVLSAPALYSVEALNAAWQSAPPTLVAGSALDAFGERLALGAAATVPRERSRAAALIEVAAQLLAEGRTVDATHALPVYLRDKVAQTTQEREAARAAKEVAT